MTQMNKNNLSFNLGVKFQINERLLSFAQLISALSAVQILKNYGR